jgi:hypothetical protein
MEAGVAVFVARLRVKFRCYWSWDGIEWIKEGSEGANDKSTPLHLSRNE